MSKKDQGSRKNEEKKDRGSRNPYPELSNAEGKSKTTM